MLDRILEVLIRAAMRGAREVLAVRARGALEARYKHGRELVTEADQRSDAAMLAVFRDALGAELDGGAPISLRLEESGEQGRPGPRWIGADPLDGTNHFAAGGHFYSVQAHYVEDGVPRAGVVFQPEAYLPLVEAKRCLGRLAYATRGQGAFGERTEFDGESFTRGPARRVITRPVPDLQHYVACVPLSTKMSAAGWEQARKVLESGIVSVTTGAGGAGGNVMLAIFGGQHVYANFGAGEDLDLIPPQVIAEEAGLTVWGLDRRPPVWHVRKQPFVAAPSPEIAERFLAAAGL